MKKMFLILRRDYEEMRSTAAFRIMIIVAAFITIAASVGISVALRLQSWYGVQETVSLLDMIIGLVLYFLPFIILMIFVWAFASIQITKEKANGNIECLMATPIEPETLWVGKCIAVFAPAFLITVIASFIAVSVINLAAIQPGWGVFILPSAALVSGLIVNPLLFFAILGFIVLFSLASNPDIAAAPSLLIGFGLMIGMPVGLMTGTIDISSWSFTLWYTFGTALAWLIVLGLTRMLTRQNIVLSSKGS
ncbi:MAG: hypothetical protein PHT28_03180 [Dehalococcoidales bacterium]|jgi:ABC-type Na+ efflux pump permease subunit|nr:hypothetical protein [Dehalococcoidales bacterium]MDD4229995.1 hypothetical protein [Dehalococcoidales bacterium]MDD4465410.1 hypothetical protein [Dehalococcoidales bacterium]MDD5401735.1 hypothetical protein [Dehalococcoidales bacterium]